MKLKHFKDWRILPKIVGTSLLGVFLLAAVVLFYLLPVIERNEIDSRKRAVRQAVEVATGIVTGYDEKVKAGLIPLEDAKKQAAADIKRLRYSKKEYFWINDSSARLIAHPLRPENEGKDMSGFKDADGKLIYREFVAAATSADQQGFVPYRQIKPNEKTPLPKISFVKRYAPWDWVIGTGIYIDDIQADLAILRLKVGVAILLSGAIACLLVLYAGFKITKPLRAVVSNLRDIAQGEGDLTRKISVESADEIGDLGRAFNGFIEKLHDLIARVVQDSIAVAAAAEQIKSASDHTATAAETVAAQAATVATAGEEMAATSTEISSNCSMVAENSRRANDTALRGSEIVQKTLSVMNRIGEMVTTSAATVGTLGSRSDQIGAIIGTIEDIADQTNLLALNAAIEAARAGEQGRGFAVVADEVRALAERTTKATKEISAMIKSIQSETHSAVSSMEDGVQEVGKGSQDASRSGEALNQILAEIGELTTQVNQIAVAAEEQTATTGEITRNMMQITEVVRQTADSAHESSAATDNLMQVSSSLLHLVGQFRLASNGR